MSYFGLVTTLDNVHKDPNSDRLYLAECYKEGVVVGPDSKEGEVILYLPQDGQIERWFGNAFHLFRKNEDGTPQGGYIENNCHVRAVKLRGNQSSGVVIPLKAVYEQFGDQGWNLNDKVSEINGKFFCQKYIPKQKTSMPVAKTSYKGKKAEGVVYPFFEMHSDTEQLAYNLDQFKPGDVVNLSLKMHGTSSRHMRTRAELPQSRFRKFFHLKKKTKPVYVCGSRRCVVGENSEGYYGTEAFRIQHHKELEPYVEEGMEIFAEIVGYYGPGEGDTIMPIADNTKLNDKAFIKEFGPKTVFNYGCKPGESKLYIYRITSNNGEKEWNPDEISKWCDERGLNHVPYIETFEFTTVEDLNNRINKYFEDLHDPIGKTHIKEGVVVRILNRPTGWKAYKSKDFEFKVLSGIAAEHANTSDMSEDMLSEL